MGMTAKQFNVFVRMMIDALEDARQTEGVEKNKKLDRIIENLKNTQED